MLSAMNATSYSFEHFIAGVANIGGICHTICFIQFQFYFI